MFGRIASEALGLSDIGKVITPADYDKVEADDYVMHEDEERIFFLIKSKADEYCFTNNALIHVDGDSAVSKKRTLRRYAYARNPIANISMETAGTVDLDVEIKFDLGERGFSIDVHKDYVESIKDLYKALLAIGEIAHENRILLQHAHRSVEVTSKTLGYASLGQLSVVEAFNGINQAAYDWLEHKQRQLVVKDFGSVFERYIRS